MAACDGSRVWGYYGMCGGITIMIMLRKEVNNYEEYKALLAVEAYKMGLNRLYRDRQFNRIGLSDYCVGLMELIVSSNLNNDMKSDLYDFAMNFTETAASVTIKENQLHNCLHWYDFDSLCNYLSKKGFSGYVKTTKKRDVSKLAYIYISGTIRKVKE